MACGVVEPRLDGVAASVTCGLWHTACDWRCMKRLLWSVAAGLVLGLPARIQADVAVTDTPVLDMDVGLGQTRDLRQATPVQLRQGAVRGLLARFTPPASAGEERAAVGFASFKSSLAASQLFDGRGCRASQSRVGVWFELDAPDLLVREPGALPLWITRGVRVFALVGRRDNQVATSAFVGGVDRPHGLSQPGRKLVQAIIQAGALIDVSALSDAALFDVLELARQAGAPLIATGASARAVLQRPGSLSDWQLRAIAATGGVVGVTLNREQLSSGPASLADVVRHVEHLMRVAGPRAVALASGFETGIVPPAALNDATRLPKLAAALQARGMSRADVERLFYYNAKRVLCDVAAADTESAASEEGC